MTSLPSSAACSTIFVCLSINSVYFVSSSTSIHGIYTLCGKAAVRSAPVVSSRSSVCVERVCCQLGFIRIHAFSRIIDFRSLQLLTQQRCLLSFVPSFVVIVPDTYALTGSGKTMSSSLPVQVLSRFCYPLRLVDKRRYILRPEA